jgi:hypothetical protein
MHAHVIPRPAELAGTSAAGEHLGDDRVFKAQSVEMAPSMGRLMAVS